MPLFGAWTTGTADAPAVPRWVTPTHTLGTGTATGLGMAQATQWVLLSNQTATTTSTYFGAEDWVDHQQYLALAHNRVAACRVRTEQAERILAEQAQQAQQAQEAARRMHEEAKAALARSRELLLANLSLAQRKTFEENKWFIVQGGKTKQTYRIRTENYTGNIDVLNRSGKVDYRLCAHCRHVPLHDHHLAQKISLECDEEYFLGIANRH